MKRVVVIGEGAWGTAIATVLAHNGYKVTIWCHYAEVAQSINTRHRNDRFLPGIDLDKNIEAVVSLQEALEGAIWIFVAIPVVYLRSVLIQAVPWVNTQQIWVVLSKGIEQNTFVLPSTIIEEVFQNKVSVAVCAGPSFALDVANKKLTGVMIASHNNRHRTLLREMLSNRYFISLDTDDVIGVQIGGAMKNVMAIMVGMMNGAGYADNTKALCVTLGLQEIEQVNALCGGQQKTLYGLAGIGDLLLTAYGKLSRNLAFGMELGYGKNSAAIIEQMGIAPEGVNTVKSLYQLGQRRDVSLYLCSALYEVIFNQMSIDEFLEKIVASTQAH